MFKSETGVEARLSALCASPELSDVVYPFEFIKGCVFAAAAAPEIPMPEVWLPWVIKKSNQLTSVEQADELTDLLMGLLQNQLKDMSDEIIQLPAGIGLKGNSQQKRLSLWCQGMLLGHSQLEGVWQNAWDKMQVTKQEEMQKLQKDLSHCLYMFTTFADMSLAVTQAKQRGNDNLEDMLPKIFQSFGNTMKIYVGLSGRLVDFLPNQFETFEQQ
ncbi:UPF0149 family protein [Paraglaciecola sp. 2405UD69-4]|uniref:UPF0149 family protein n=1 Tax=Paraglaciecola sp. 2405UD69-4 TaxID=3391836 RepID=UPI0039C988DB